MKSEEKKYAELFMAVSTDIEEAATKSWEDDFNKFLDSIKIYIKS